MPTWCWWRVALQLQHGFQTAFETVWTADRADFINVPCVFMICNIHLLLPATMHHDMLNVTSAMDHSADSAMSTSLGWCFKLIVQSSRCWCLLWLLLDIHSLVLRLARVVHSHDRALKKLTQKRKVEKSLGPVTDIVSQLSYVNLGAGSLVMSLISNTCLWERYGERETERLILRLVAQWYPINC